MKVIAVGLGSKEAGLVFSEKTGFPAAKLHADELAACYKALEYSAGFLPESSVNGYAKLLPMLAGIGSPGTVQVHQPSLHAALRMPSLLSALTVAQESASASTCDP